MATEKLLEGAVTFGPAGWDGSGIADSNDYIINVPFGPITAGLDQSGLTTGIESMEFYPGASGIVGGGALGALLISADNVGKTAFVNNYGAVTLYLSSSGGPGVINNFACGPMSINYLVAGTITTIVQDGGQLNVSASVVFTTFQQGTGTSTIEYNATDATTIEINGGQSIVRRLPTNLVITGGDVYLDPDPAEDVAGKSITVNGGNLTWVAGAIPTTTLNGGVVDFSRAKIAFSAGTGTYSSACRIIPNNSRVDISNITPAGSSKTDVGSPSPL